MRRIVWLALAVAVLGLLVCGCKKAGGGGSGLTTSEARQLGPQGTKAKMMEKGKATGAMDSKSAPAPQAGAQVK
jgi:hypothetical protein